MKRAVSAALLSALVVMSCGGESGSSDGSQSDAGPSNQECELPNDLSRRNDVPIGVLMPDGTMQRQSYTSGAEVATAGLNAVSLGFTLYYTAAGDVTFDFDGNSDDSAKERWKNSLRCTVIEAKDADLVVAVWGQFVEANRRGEPGAMAEDIRDTVLESSVALMPEIATLLEELKVEYWAPISELDKFVGTEKHNEYFPQMVAAGRDLFTGTMYVQPNILDRNGFVVQEVEPQFGAVDALGIAWISYECEADKLPPGKSLAWADYFVDAAQKQGITRVYISELGDTRAADETARPCLEQLIDYWGGTTNGVFLLDMPNDFPDGASIKGSWQEQVLQSLR